MYPVEVGYTGYTGASIQGFPQITGSKLRNSAKDLVEGAEQGNLWLWLPRKDKTWGKHGSKGRCQGGARETALLLLQHLEMFRD